jgi:hypothetical protein
VLEISGNLVSIAFGFQHILIHSTFSDVNTVFNLEFATTLAKISKQCEKKTEHVGPIDVHINVYGRTRHGVINDFYICAQQIAEARIRLSWVAGRSEEMIGRHYSI